MAKFSISNREIELVVDGSANTDKIDMSSAEGAGIILTSAIVEDLTINNGEFSTVEIQDLTYTAVTIGEQGDDISITYEDDGSAGSETVDVVDLAITVHMEDGSSTADGIAIAINNSIAALELISVDVTGTGTNAQTVQEAFLDDGEDSQVNVETSTFNFTDHGFITGLEVELTATNPPAPLDNGSSYFVIKLNANQFQLALTEQDALDGVFIELEDNGTGLSMFGVEDFTTGEVQLEVSNDGVNFIDYGTPVTVDGDAAKIDYFPAVNQYIRLKSTSDDGIFVLKARVNITGNRS